MLPTREFHLTVLGANAVGKTSIMNRLCGIQFNRKTAYKSSMEDTSNKYSVETNTSAGLILFHFYD